MSLTRTRMKVPILLGAVCAAFLAFTGPAAAASATYPGGGSGFSDGAEGWSAGGASCAPAALLCSSEAAYDATTGNPPGSIAAKTTVTLNLVGLFKGTAAWDSPQFTVPVKAITGADLHLDRAFSAGGLVDVGPEATYTVTLADLSSKTSATVLSQKVDGEDKAFASAGAPAAVVGGHTYRLSIEAVTAQSTLALSTLSGTTSLRFDNVGLTVQSAEADGDDGGSGGKGKGDGNGSGPGKGGDLSDGRLLSLLGGAGSSPAVLKGKGGRLLVKVSCPRKVHRACSIAAQGLLSKRRPATRKRVVKVASGKSKRVVLRVKPRARQKLAKRKRLLVREKVRAGSARATVYRQRKLIRRG
jgi:hypothetical protein